MPKLQTKPAARPAAAAPALSVAELEAALEAARSTARDTADAHTAVEAERAEVLLDGTSEEKAAHRERRASAEDAKDAAIAAVTRLEGQLAEAQDRDWRAAIAERRAAAEKARKQAEAIIDRYAELAAEIVDGLAAIAQAELLVQEANVDLPGDIEALPRVESRLRNVPAQAERVLSERKVRVWCFKSSGMPLADDVVGRVVDTGNDEGWLSRDDHEAPGSPIYVCRRLFLQQTIVPALPVSWTADFSSSLSLPPAKAGTPAPWSPKPFLSPSDILRQIEAYRAAAAKAIGPGEPRTRLVEIEDEPAADAA